MERLRKNIGALFLLMLFTEFWCSTHLFYHSHIIDGQLVVHSHIFNYQGSQHSGQELKLISILSVFLSSMPEMSSPDFRLPDFTPTILHFRPCDGHIRIFPVHTNGLRAPPVSTPTIFS